MLEELIEAVEMMDGRGLHQTDHARSKPWRCCYVPVISFRVYRVGSQGPRAQVSRAGVLHEGIYIDSAYPRIYSLLSYRLIEGARHRRPSCVYFLGTSLFFLLLL